MSADTKRLWQNLADNISQLETAVEELSENLAANSSGRTKISFLNWLVRMINKLIRFLSRLFGIRSARPINCESMQRLFSEIEKICKTTVSASLSEDLKNKMKELDLLLGKFSIAFLRLKTDMQKKNSFPCDEAIVEQIAPAVNSKYFRIQSKYLYMQAAGSEGKDGTAKGIHLRWSFADSLANHLPKGNMAASGTYATTNDHNRADDFVFIYRKSYNRSAAPVLDLAHTRPLKVNLMYGREWIFEVPGFDPSKMITVTIRFKDAARYDATGLDPFSDSFAMLKAYNGLLEIACDNNLLFGAGLYFSAATSATRFTQASPSLLVETWSASHGDPGAKHTLSSRNKFTCRAGESGSGQITAENIAYLLLRCEGTFLSKIRLEPYTDLYNSFTQEPALLRLSLPTNDNEAFRGLEDPARFKIDNKWPQYNDGTTLRVSNYKSKWTDTQNGVKKALSSYLLLSRNDSQAVEMRNAQDSLMPVSYLQLLNMIAADYHTARMLGLGYIDTPSTVPADGFIYVAVYYGKKEMLYRDEEINYTHIGLVHMSLPTLPGDHRLPAKPRMRDITYGLNMSSLAAQQLYDERGYSPFYNTRFVNIGRRLLDAEQPVHTFFEADALFNTGDHSKAILYGIEYKKQDEQRCRKPEITTLIEGIPPDEYMAFDNEFPEGIPETVLVQDSTDPSGSNSLFVHHETEAGIHAYAIYGVNWFSRASERSSFLLTDETVFIKRNTLLPPSNVAAQYIQREDPLIFTSRDEQEMLAAREHAESDSCFTRITFDYNHTHNIAYQKGNTIRFYFRQELPYEVKGEILNVQGNTSTSMLTLNSYLSVDTNTNISPLIPEEMYPRFIGGLLHTKGEQFVVKEIKKGLSPYPLITVENLAGKKMQLVKEVDDESGEVTQTYQNTSFPLVPEKGQRFSLIENMAAEAQWTRLDKQVEIVEFSEHTEEEITAEGNTSILTIGGITGNASITSHAEILQVENSSEKPIEGLYKLSFGSASLQEHPDKDVSWYKGVARINGLTMEVMTIESKSPLVLWTYYTGSETQPLPAAGAVNFHPGYKVYLYPEPQNGFDAAHVEPQSAHSRTTLIAAQAADNQGAALNASAVSTPAPLMARKIVVPLRPEQPQGLNFATRPDFYGKSTYTFDTKVITEGRSPFGFVFFRSDDTAILNALYKRETVATIEERLQSDEFIANRFRELIDVTENSFTDGQFKEYGGYALPDPDKAPFLPDMDVAGKIRLIKKAMDSIFVPLTKQPPLFDWIKEGRQTSGAPPLTRNLNGAVLPSSEADAFPMVRKFTDDGRVVLRFTDYTLDGNSVNIFFYSAAEISSQLVMSERSAVSAPVRLLNTSAPECPVIKEIITQTANPVQWQQPAIVFRINNYLANDNVEKVNVYRAYNAADARSVRTMTLAATCETDAIQDKFSDLAFPPFGEMIYYRLVALRSITNEREEYEFVPSKPSELIVSNIIDVINPAAPAFSYSYSHKDPENNLQNVQLKWKPTCYNGTYHLYKMTRKGNWEKLYTTKSNSEMSFPPEQDFENYPQTKILAKKDAEGRTIYHRFKIEVVNASGLYNLTGNEQNI